jgi:hypothetical protein
MPLSPAEQTKLDKTKGELLKSDHEYLKAHPELSALVSDLMARILEAKPADPISFAAEYAAKK